MSIRDSSLKELIALAQQRLGTKAGELKTRQQLIDALEAIEKKKVPKVMVALSTPLPEVLPVIERELPPEPVIWTGDSDIPKITAEVPTRDLPTERLVWSAQVIVPSDPIAEKGPRSSREKSRDEPPPQPATPVSRATEGAHPSTSLGTNGAPSELPATPVSRATEDAHPSTSLGTNGASSDLAAQPVSRAIEDAHPSTSLGTNGAPPATPSPVSVTQFSSEEHVPQFTVPPASRPSPTVTRNFFVEPAAPSLPASYGDNRVLTFRRDPTTVYAAWDLAPVEHAEGRVVNREGQTLESFAVTASSGGKFLETKPGDVKIEIRAGDALVAESGWVPTKTPPPAARNATSSAV